MKKLLLLIFVFATTLIFGHRQHVHQYLTMEAYRLLRLHIGHDIPKILERLGGLENYYIGDRPWQRRTNRLI